LRLFIAPCFPFSYCCHNGTLSFKETLATATTAEKTTTTKTTKRQLKTKT